MPLHTQGMNGREPHSDHPQARLSDGERRQKGNELMRARARRKANGKRTYQDDGDGVLPTLFASAKAAEKTTT